VPGTSADAARLAGILWAAIRTAGGPDTRAGQEERHLPGALDLAWLASLPLPLGGARPPGQPVALLEDREEDFERHADSTALAVAYAARPRTQVSEDIGSGQDRHWYALTARHLTCLSGSSLHVTCNIFASRHGDETFRKHRDTWYGAVIQISGAKQWTLGEALFCSDFPAPRQVATSAVDILLIPKYVPHMVTTPSVPGHSVHLAFAIDRDPAPALTPQPDQRLARAGLNAQP
jgi:hypothetical protein